MGVNVRLGENKINNIDTVSLLSTNSTATIPFNYTLDANATSGDILSGKSGYVSGTKVNGSITIKSAQTYTPTTSDQTVAAGQYLSGAQTVKGDANLVAGNIKKDVIVFGVTGTYEGSGGAQPQLASIWYLSGFADATNTYDSDLAVNYYNGVWGSAGISLEIYRDNTLIKTISLSPTADTTLLYRAPLQKTISLRELNIGVTGTHDYKVRVVSTNYTPSDFSLPYTYQMFAKYATISISGDTLTVSSDDPFTSAFKLYSYIDYQMSTLLATINKTGDSTTFDLSSLQLSDGVYRFYIIPEGTGIRDGHNSNFLNYEVASGYTVTKGNVDANSGSETYVYIKKDSAPQNENDYDYHCLGGEQYYSEDNIPDSFKATKLYIWGNTTWGFGQYPSITSPVQVSLTNYGTYDTAYELTLTGNITIGITYYYDT